jgi:hypothetical protein
MYDEAPNDSNEGCVGILKVETFKPEYQKPQYQLFRIQCGFGASPSKMGNAVFGYFCVDGEECRQERYDFIGIANEDVTRYAEELEKAWKEGQ